MALDTGTRFGAYEILERLSVIGEGEVYKASDTQQNRTVTIKLLPPHLSEDPEAKQRFEREVRTLSALNHPNICALHEIGREGETDFLVTEYVEGETLAKRLDRGAFKVAQENSAIRSRHLFVS